MEGSFARARGRWKGSFARRNYVTLVLFTISFALLVGIVTSFYDIPVRRGALDMQGGTTHSVGGIPSGSWGIVSQQSIEWRQCGAGSSSITGSREPVKCVLSRRRVAVAGETP